MISTKFLLATAMVLLAAGAQAVTINVPSDHATLAEALAASNTGDVIELAPGTYRTIGVTVSRGVSIRGLGSDPRSVVLDARSGGRIMSIEYLSEPVWIQNLTFRNGFALGESTNLQSGGALFVNDANVVLQNCRFENNRADAHGGAVRAIRSQLRISQCDFVGNSAQLGGGAIDAATDAAPTVLRSMFQGNNAMWGGAVSCRGGAAPVFTGCDFVTNRAAGILAYGGAIYADYSASPSFENCTFHGNEARLGGALACFQGSNVAVSLSTLVGNTGTETGGGIFCLDGAPSIESSIIAFQDGTGITSEATGLPEVACTDVWNNRGGDVSGPLGGDGTASLIEADPQFCADGGVDGAFFPLSPDSPLAPEATACAAIGAWPVGCTRELPEIESFDAQLSGGYLTVRWTATGDTAHDRYRLTWAGAGPEHEILITHQGDGNYTAFTPLPPAAGADFTLQLYARGVTQSWESLLDPQVGTDDPDDSTPPPSPGILAVRNWPNPFNPKTTIAFDVPRDKHVRVTNYSAAGRRVAVVHDAFTHEGSVNVIWSGQDSRGRSVASGTYVVQVQGEQNATSHKISLLK